MSRDFPGLPRSREELEALVAVRIAELEKTQASLLHVRKMEAIGHLTGGIAHDFNNLLTGVTGALDLMLHRLRKGQTTDLERYVNLALTSANRAASLTNRLLAFARRQPLDPRPLDANQLLLASQDLLRHTLGAAAELSLLPAQGLWLTLCDAEQLRNALLNLVRNASEAMPDGGTLTIATGNAKLARGDLAGENGVLAGRYVCISVSDTGIGMNADVLGQVFDPFFTTKPLGQGTGLGLSTIYGFARQSEGCTTISSVPGKGTTVKLYFPRYAGNLDKAPLEASRGDTGGEKRAAGIVLVVEDEPEVRALIVDALHDMGYRTLEAADGPTGLQVLQSDAALDLLLTDIGLPGLNGKQLAQAGRQARPGLKVLLMTGYDANAIQAAGLAQADMPLLNKPFTLDSLARRIQDMLHGPPANKRVSSR